MGPPVGGLEGGILPSSNHVIRRPLVKFLFLFLSLSLFDDVGEG